LIGRWKTEGTTTDASGRAVDRIDAIDTYKRLPGGAVLHLIDARSPPNASPACPPDAPILNVWLSQEV
jgi:hypothetical protein